MKQISDQQYAAWVKEASPNSPVLKDCLFAFFTGGLICTGAQALCDLYRSWGLSLQDARTGVSLSLIALAATLTALGVYDNLAKHAGAGMLVPITGFANSMTAPALEFKSEGFVTGLGAKMFVVSGPVLVYGISASIVYGLILLLFRQM